MLLMLRYLPNVVGPVRIFGGVGDTVNITNVKTRESILEKAAGTVYYAPMTITTTPDRNVDRIIRETAREAGFTEDTINKDIVPSVLLNLGVEEDCDELIVGARFAFFYNPDDKA
jgi:hypothetical protein